MVLFSYRIHWLFYWYCTLHNCNCFLCVLTECILFYVLNLGHILLKSSIVKCYNINKLTYLPVPAYMCCVSKRLFLKKFSPKSAAFNNFCTRAPGIWEHDAASCTLWSKKRSPYFLNKSVKMERFLILFNAQNHKAMWRVTNLSIAL